jgi:hypothetical protein
VFFGFIFVCSLVLDQGETSRSPSNASQRWLWRVYASSGQLAEPALPEGYRSDAHRVIAQSVWRDLGAVRRDIVPDSLTPHKYVKAVSTKLRSSEVGRSLGDFSAVGETPPAVVDASWP